jgi:small conductance mechanosensitive channel
MEADHRRRWANPRALELAQRVNRRAVRRARIKTLVLVAALALVLLLYHLRSMLGPEWALPVRIGTAIALLGIGWELARDLARSLTAPLLRRLATGTAGTVDFLLRLTSLLVAIVVALRIAGLAPRTLALGGALTAVIVGLAAQQTIGNVFAGIVLLTARPFRIGEEVRLQGGALAGTLEGRVVSLGLLYTTFADVAGPVMVPNAVVLSVASAPLREPRGVGLRARLRPGMTPSDVEQLLRERIETPLRSGPRVTLEEVDGDEVVVRIEAMPRSPDDGPRLASAVLEAISPIVRAGD